MTASPLPDESEALVGALVGARFEAVSPAPGNQPDRFTVVAAINDRWVKVQRAHGSQGPCQVASLLNPKLYRQLPRVTPSLDAVEALEIITALLNEELPWARWPWQRCPARTDRMTTYHGRCELLRGHLGAHALERGMDTPRWSTRWTR